MGRLLGAVPRVTGLLIRHPVPITQRKHYEGRRGEVEWSHIFFPMAEIE